MQLLTPGAVVALNTARCEQAIGAAVPTDSTLIGAIYAVTLAKPPVGGKVHAFIQFAELV